MWRRSVGFILLFVGLAVGLGEVEKNDLKDDSMGGSNNNDTICNRPPALHQFGPKENCAIVSVQPSPANHDYSAQLPWLTRKGTSSTLTGFMIEWKGEKYILTHHMVRLRESFLVQRDGETRPYAAKLLAVSGISGLTLLKVEDPKFYQNDCKPLELGDVPNAGDELEARGYSLCFLAAGHVTSCSGKVNKLVMDSIDEPMGEAQEPKILMAEFDARTNAGDVGGPTFNADGKVAGVLTWMRVAKTLFRLSQNVYLITTPVIKQFLLDFDRNGHNVEFHPGLGATVVTKLANPMAAKFYGVSTTLPDRIAETSLTGRVKKTLGIGSKDKKSRGVLVKNVDMPWVRQCRSLNPQPKCSIGLEDGDVLLTLNGYEIASDGTIELKKDSRIPWDYALLGKFVGDECTAVVWRDGQLIEVSITLPNNDRQLLPGLKFTRPSYVFYGGVLFVHSFRQNLFRIAPKESNILEFKERDDDQDIRVPKVYETAASIGMAEVEGKKLLKVNNQSVRNMEGLLKLLDSSSENGLTKFEFEKGYVFWMNSTEVGAGREAAKDAFFIPRDRYLAPIGELL